VLIIRVVDNKERNWSFGGFLSLVQKFGVGKCVSLAVVGVVCLLRTSSRDDDDEFLYGDSELKESSLSTVTPLSYRHLVRIPSAAQLLYSTRSDKIYSTFCSHSPRVRVSC
jgi:hypothetical protein